MLHDLTDDVRALIRNTVHLMHVTTDVSDVVALYPGKPAFQAYAVQALATDPNAYKNHQQGNF